jgi:Uma2 family endonuclease
LVVEIAVTSADLDREKASVFAAAGVAEYVLVFVDECRIELRSHPAASAYAQCQQFAEHDHLVL